MNHLLSKRILSIAVILSVALLSGCNSLNTMVSDETKYGQIYMLESILSDAAADCGNREHLFDSKQWAMQVSESLSDYVDYLDVESASYIESRELLKQLPKIAGYYGEPRCEEIVAAAAQSRKVIVALTGKPVVVASL